MAISQTEISKIYLYGSNEHKNYPVDVVDVTVTATTKLGDILKADGTIADTGNEASAKYILIDERLITGDGLAAGVHKLKVLARDCGVGESYIQVGTGANIATAKTALVALGFKFESQLPA